MLCLSVTSIEYAPILQKLLPPQEDKELMIKGVLELLELPENLP